MILKRLYCLNAGNAHVPAHDQAHENAREEKGDEGIGLRRELTWGVHEEELDAGHSLFYSRR